MTSAFYFSPPPSARNSYKDASWCPGSPQSQPDQRPLHSPAASGQLRRGQTAGFVHHFGAACNFFSRKAQIPSETYLMTSAELDVESLQKSGQRRRACLDAFLVGSVMLLFVAVSALTAGGLMVLKGLEGQKKIQPYGFQPENLKGVPPSPAYKMENFAFLQPTLSELDNATMTFAEVEYGAGTSVGSNFDWNGHQNSLQPKKKGVYFVYLTLSVSCTHECNAGLLRMTVDDILTCDVELEANKTSASKTCWTVSGLQGQRLSTQMRVLNDKLGNWKLVLKDSSLGIFLVD
ncbi:uncharacterized protein ACNS7B_004547 [Menidia menidia]